VWREIYALKDGNYHHGNQGKRDQIEEEFAGQREPGTDDGGDIGRDKRPSLPNSAPTITPRTGSGPSR
jgi:hypothetical protein